MALFLGNKSPVGLYLGNKSITEIYLGNKLIYANQAAIYKDGVLMDGATLTNFQQRASDLYLYVSRGMQSGSSYNNLVGYVLFDMTRYNTITVKGQTWCYGYSGNSFSKRLGIDTAMGSGGVELPSGFNDLFDHGIRADFEETFDVSELTGMHTLAGYVMAKNISSYYGTGSYISITEIIGGR